MAAGRGTVYAESAERLVAYWRSMLARYSEYYRALGLGAIVASARSPAEVIRAVPITTKEDLIANIDRFLLKARAPFSPPAWRRADVDRWTGPSDDVRRLLAMHGVTESVEAFRREWLPIHFQRSGGSTGQSVMTAYTWADVHGPFVESAYYLYRVTGVDPGRLVFNLCPAGPHLGIYATLLIPALIGQPNFNTFGGKVMSTEEQVALATVMQPGALVGITSYVGHWARVAGEAVSAGELAPLSDLNTVICVGEPVSDGYRERLSGLFAQAGARSVRVVEGMSSTEMRGAGFYECAPGSGLHVDSSHYYVEVVDPKTHQPLPAGVPGVYVWSHIGWRGHALARYWSGDYVHGGMVDGPCTHCGRDGLRLVGPLTRYDHDFVKIRGARVELLGLYDAIRSVEGVATFQVVARKANPADSTSRDLLEIAVGASKPGAVSAQRVREAVARRVELTADEVAVMAIEDVERRLFEGNVKAKQFLDLREGEQK